MTNLTRNDQHTSCSALFEESRASALSPFFWAEEYCRTLSVTRTNHVGPRITDLLTESPDTLQSCSTCLFGDNGVPWLVSYKHQLK